MIRKTPFLFAIFLCSLFVSGVFAEVVKLKSGRQIQGKIIERTDSYIKVEVAGVVLTYFLDDISAIEPAQLSSPNPPSQPLGLSPVDSYNDAWRKEFERQKPNWRDKISQYIRFDRINGIYLIVFPLTIFLSLFFGFSLKAILVLASGLVVSLIARTVFNNPSAANVISYIFALFTAYLAMKNEVFRS